MTTGEIISILMAIIANIGTVYLLRSNRKKIESEVESNKTATDKMQEEITNMVIARQRDEMKRFEDEFNNLLRGAWTLHKQLVDNHITPKYVPPRQMNDDDANINEAKKPKRHMGQPR
jgi:hypothetical protein